jgi:hypothetical protein
MVWSYHSVKKLRQKFNNGEEITAAEKRKLEKYIRQKKKVAHLARGNWSEKQLKRAEFLLHKIKKQDRNAIEVENQ